MPTFLLCVDGSPSALAACRVAAGLAPKDARVVVVSVAQELDIGAYAAFAADVPAVDRRLRFPSHDDVRRSFEEAGQILRAAGLAPEFVEATGEPAESILELSEKLAADVVVVGPKGQGAVSRFLLGSVSERVARHARCSVLVARER